MDHFNFKVARKLFQCTCVVATLSMIGYWCIKFAKDEDISVVEFKEYAKYDTPGVSMCFANPFIEGKLEKHGNGINSKSYSNFLLGKHYDERMKYIDVDNVTENINDYLIEYYVIWKNGTAKSLFLNDTYVTGKVGFKTPYVSYQGFFDSVDAEEWIGGHAFFNCFAIEIMDEKIQLLSLALRPGIYPNGIRPQYKRFIVLFHRPGQLLRSLPTIKYLWPLRPNNYTVFSWILS